MIGKVFCSFCGSEEINRVRIVTDRLAAQGAQKIAGIISRQEFEGMKKKGGHAIQNWIREQLDGTSVTVVLLGTNTLKNNFVQYQIWESMKRGNAIIGVYINRIRDMQTQKTEERGNIHIVVAYYKYGTPVYFDYINDGMYDYITDDGYHNLNEWIEEAAKKRQGRETNKRWRTTRSTLCHMMG